MSLLLIKGSRKIKVLKRLALQLNRHYFIDGDIHMFYRGCHLIEQSISGRDSTNWSIPHAILKFSSVQVCSIDVSYVILFAYCICH